MGKAAVSAAVPWKGRCFPIVSFLHVPGKMSKPLWLMMGTAFPFQPPVGTDGVAAPQLLLTAKHTFAPWDYAKDASQLKIPPDYRKLRFVVGQMYHPNDEGHAVASERVALRLVSQHPTADVAVLTVDSRVISAAAPSATTVEGDTPPPTSTAAPSAAVFHSPLTLCTTRYPSASAGLILGYRGLGRLGELDTLDPSLLQRLSPLERETLLKDLQDIEGKQVHASTTVTILDERGMCKGTGDTAACFHGMSGGPVLTTAGTCAGVLYGRHPDAPGCLGYTPCADFAEWLDGVVQRLVKRQ
jgi:hypothetical protein